MTIPENPQQEPERSWGPASPTPPAASAPHDDVPLPDEPPYDPEYDDPRYRPADAPADLAGAEDDARDEQPDEAFEEQPLSAEAQEPLVAAALAAQDQSQQPEREAVEQAQPEEPELAIEQAPPVEEPERVEEPEPPIDEAPPAEEPAAAVPGGRRGLGLLVGAVAVLAVLGIVLLALLFWPKLPWATSLQDDREGALDAARAGARAVFSYDYRHLDKDIAAGKDATTGQFRSEYERTTGKIIKDVAPRYKAVVVADVSDAGVVRAKPGRVTVLAFVDQQSTSSLVSGSKLTQSRLEMTLVKKNGHWLIEDIRAF